MGGGEKSIVDHRRADLFGSNYLQAIIKEVSAVVTTLTTAKSSLDLDINIDQGANDGRL